MASQKHVTLLINNRERSNVERWSDEKVFVLIDLPKSCECLYDVMFTSHKYRTGRHQWCAILTGNFRMLRLSSVSRALAAEPIEQGGQLPVHFLPPMGKPCSLPYHFLAPRSDNCSWQSCRKWALSCIISLTDRSSRQKRSKRNLPVVLLTSLYYLHPLGGCSPPHIWRRPLL